MDTISQVWGYLVAAITLVLAVVSSGHAILYKRDPRAAVSWVGFVWLVPLLGPLLYFVLGINRIRRQAVSLRADLPKLHDLALERHYCADLQDTLPRDARHFTELRRLCDKVSDRALLAGNRIDPLINGDEAYAAMFAGIESAKQSVSLATYIFDNDSVGNEFVERLRGAMSRGVEVRVLIDDAGLRYSWPSIIRKMKRCGIPVARFLPTRLFNVTVINLRNHRKILVVDGCLGFTGGMNIREGHALSRSPKHPTQDIHFRVEGPVVRHLQEVFAEDWLFATKEDLSRELWFPELSNKGAALARGLVDGPDEDFEKLRWIILGALATAKRRVIIVTPYFLPDQGIVSALNTAAMRGVQLDIILPAKSNLPFVQWAMFAQLWQVLIHGCKVWLTVPPFDHSKFMLVDGLWSLVGSANWDARSLRLNFEFNLECYDSSLCGQLQEIAELKMQSARLLTLSDVDSRSIPVRFRDGVARLLTPYL